jgi:hypothetical protein
MGAICCEKTTGRVREYVRHGMPASYDAAVHDLLEADAPPPEGTRWDGAAWVPLPPKTDQEKAADATEQLDGQVLLKAVALWCAQRFGVTPAQARTEIAVIYRSLV